MQGAEPWPEQRGNSVARAPNWISTIIQQWMCALQLGLRATLNWYTKMHGIVYHGNCSANNQFHPVLRTHLVSVLRGDVEDFCTWLGIKCSTWVSISRPTTLRSFFDPLGNQALESVRQGNLQASRAALVICLVICLYGTFVVGQPSSSILWRHHRLQWVCRLVRVRGLYEEFLNQIVGIYIMCMHSFSPSLSFSFLVSVVTVDCSCSQGISVQLLDGILQ